MAIDLKDLEQRLSKLEKQFHQFKDDVETALDKINDRLRKLERD